MALVPRSFRPLRSHWFSGSSHRTIINVVEAPTLPQRSTLPSSRLDGLETTPHLPTASPALGPVVPPGDLIFEFRHSGWADRRRCVWAALQHLPDSQSRRDRFECCGTNAWVMQSIDDPSKYRIACDKCKDRFCTPCACERARHVAACVGDFAEGRDLRLVTLTLAKSARSIKADLDRLYAAFVKLRRRAPWRQTQSGGVYFVEIKRRRGDDGWHTHLHVLTEGTWLSKSWLSKAWYELTGDSYIVDIRRCQSGADAARYVAKYASKGVHGSCYHDPTILLEAIVALKGRRLVGKWGNWSELDLEADIPDGIWKRIGTLQRLLERSQSGETEARRIVQSLLGVSPGDPTERAPPDDQDMLFN